MAQQTYPPPPYPYPPYYPSGNGHANLAKSYMPTVMVVSLLFAVGTGTYLATNWVRDKSETERSLGQRIDGVERRLDSIDGTLKRLVSGAWAPTVDRQR